MLVIILIRDLIVLILIFCVVILYRDWQLYKQTIGRLQDFIDETRRKQSALKGKDHSTFLSGVGVAGKVIPRRPFECSRMCCSILNIGVQNINGH